MRQRGGNIFKIVLIPSFSDQKGVLSVVDSLLPFSVERIFWISDADGQTRGGHRHKKTRQALICIQGKVSVYMNNGAREETIHLDCGTKCLLVEPQDWHTMTFGENSILLVLASHAYNKADYIDAPYE